VRVHTDSRANESALAVNAIAYTVGKDIIFATNQYAPAVDNGKRLIAHELAHSIQQISGFREGSHVIQRKVVCDEDGNCQSIPDDEEEQPLESTLSEPMSSGIILPPPPGAGGGNPINIPPLDPLPQFERSPNDPDTPNPWESPVPEVIPNYDDELLPSPEAIPEKTGTWRSPVGPNEGAGGTSGEGPELQFEPEKTGTWRSPAGPNEGAEGTSGEGPKLQFESESEATRWLNENPEYIVVGTVVLIAGAIFIIYMTGGVGGFFMLPA